jgi:hypothetical protein
MKETIKKTRIIAMGLFALCTLGLKNVTFAGTKNDNPVEVKFISEINNLPVIQLNLNNSKSREYFIIIKDMHYHILYCEIVTGVDLSRTIKLNMDKEEINTPGFRVRVEVTLTETHNTEVFTINNPGGVAESTGISKL